MRTICFLVVFSLLVVFLASEVSPPAGSRPDPAREAELDRLTDEVIACGQARKDAVMVRNDAGDVVAIACVPAGGVKNLRR